jgi:hypothetical protein
MKKKSGKKLDKTLTTFTINYSIVFMFCKYITFKPIINIKMAPAFEKKTDVFKIFAPGQGFLLFLSQL